MNQEKKPAGRQGFDPLIGTWNVLNKRKQGNYFLAQPAGEETVWDTFSGRDRFEKQLAGRVVIEHWEATLPSGENALGFSVKAYEPATQEWSIIWIDNRNPLDFRPLQGKFEDGIGTFFQFAETSDGQALHVRFIWDELTETTARWQQAFSFDEGEHWETNWVMTFTREE